jgi:uncharacterized protein (TIGR03435 family)
MNPEKPNLDSNLDRLLGLFNAPSTEQLAESRNNIQRRLPDDIDAAVPLAIHSPRSGRRFRLMLMAAAVAAALVVMVVWSTKPAPAGIAETPLYRMRAGVAEGVKSGELIAIGEVLQANDGNAAIKLTDDSRVELQAKTEFYLERVEDGLSIHLNRGSVIVTAAKQHAGHLYVQTKEVTVSVVGTVFLVNAEEEGSRVAVIEGEVRVQQGADTKTLLPGEQMSTSPKLDPLPLNAPTHVALLQQSTAPAPIRTAPPRLEFGAVSIKPWAPPLVPGSGAVGFGCRGIDGIRRAPTGEFANMSFPAPQGRCVGNGIGLASFIEFAYNMPHRMGPDTPDWSRPLSNAVNERPRGTVLYQIEAAAENPSTVTLEQLRQMMRTMLVDRFKLESHVEMQEAPIYAMVIANGGIKFKETTDKSGEEYMLTPSGRGGPTGGPILRGKSRLDKLAQFVSGFINPLGMITGELASHAEDKTGLTGIYEYELALPLPGGGARGPDGGIVRPPTASAPDQPTRSYGWRAPAMSNELEHQLGLKLQLQKVRAEVLMVDKVERPTEN